MARQNVLLDTDILSAIMRKQPTALSKARFFLKEHQKFSFSIITRYEILRGLMAKGATRQTETFSVFCSKNIILPLSDEVVSKAAEIYADLSRRGELTGDADILIAATALVYGLSVSTNNERHFQRVGELHVENWLK